MNRFVGNPFVWACCIALMLWSNLSFAELSATADRRTIAMGETLRLTLLGDAGEQPAEIDLTPLNRDWEILSRSSATNARFINGQNQVTRTLEMELAPLREGTLTIPSLTAGGRSTTPLAIRVNPEPVVAPGDELVLFDASVDESSVYVQSEVILTVTLQQAITLDGRSKFRTSTYPMPLWKTSSDGLFSGASVTGPGWSRNCGMPCTRRKVVR
jgi:hypothetical protein